MVVTEETPIVNLSISNRTKAALLRTPGMLTVKDVLAKGPLQISWIGGIGRNSLFELKELLSHNGFEERFVDPKEPAKIGHNADGQPMVYFFLCEASQAVKIGHSSLARIETRLGDVRVGNPHPVQLYAYMWGNNQLEAYLHSRFEHLRMEGEWFLFQEEIRTYVESYARRFNGRWNEISQSI